MKRLLKMRGLSAVVTKDAESVLAMEEAMNAVRPALARAVVCVIRACRPACIAIQCLRA